MKAQPFAYLSTNPPRIKALNALPGTLYEELNARADSMAEGMPDGTVKALFMGKLDAPVPSSLRDLLDPKIGGGLVVCVESTRFDGGQPPALDERCTSDVDAGRAVLASLGVEVGEGVVGEDDGVAVVLVPVRASWPEVVEAAAGVFEAGVLGGVGVLPDGAVAVLGGVDVVVG